MDLQDIKINASTIWTLISSNGALSVQEIELLTGYDEKYIFMALGWLANENKILFSEREGLLYAEPMHSYYPEMYF